MSRVGDAIQETRKSLVTMFANRNLRLISLAFAGSIIGDWAYNTALVVWTYGAGGVVFVGAFQTLRYAVWALAAPLAATLADRFPRRTVMIVSDVSRAVLLLAVAWLIAIDASTWMIVVLALFNPILAAAFRPAEAALMPSLVDSPAQLTAANGVRSSIESVGFFLGPALAGLLLTVTSVPFVVIINAASFAWSALMVLQIRVPKRRARSAPELATPSASIGPDTASEARSSSSTTTVETELEAEASEGRWREFSAGFRYIFVHPSLRMVALLYTVQVMIMGASAVFCVVMAVEMTPYGASGLGYLESVLGVGAIVGGFLAIGRATAGWLARDFAIGVMLWGVPLLLPALIPFTVPAMAAMFFIGLGNSLADVNAATILQRLAPDAVLGRVFGALDMMLFAGMGVASLVMPFVLSTVGLRWSLAFIGVAVCAVVLPAMRKLRHLDDELGVSAERELLERVPLFAPLDPTSLEVVVRRLGRRRVRAGEVIIREGDIGDRFYVVESGRTSATHQGQLLSTQGPGDPFGEIALLRDVPRTATVTADEPSVLLYLDRDPFLDAVTGNSEVTNRANDLIARRTPTY